MPPSITRGSLSSLARCRNANFSIPLRSFSTTPSRAAIGPESPKFIEVPMPPQPQARPKLDIKGTLPPPRNLFPAGSEYKTTPEYFAAVTKEPQHETKPANDFVAWKRRIAAQRRENLREGLIELKKRKIIRDNKIAGIGRARSEYREKRLHTPQREDERITNPTITAATKARQTGPVPDPNREARVVAKMARAQAKEVAREEERKNALHSLYMNARSFITTEEQLDQEIEKIFVTDPHKPGDHEDNIWLVLNQPPTVQDMLSEVNNTQKKAMKFYQSPAAITGKRIARIAEELTGGKMDQKTDN